MLFNLHICFGFITVLVRAIINTFIVTKRRDEVNYRQKREAEIYKNDLERQIQKDRYTEEKKYCYVIES